MVPSGPRSFRAFWSRKRRKQSKHSKASTEPRCSENDGADFHSIPSAHSPASQSSRSAPSKVVQRKSAVLAAEPDVRVSALFYPNKSDQKPIPGGLAITRDVVYFQADPRFEQSNKRRFHSSLSWEIVIHTADLIEAGAVTSPNEESNGERRSMTVSCNYFLQIHIRGDQGFGAKGCCGRSAASSLATSHQPRILLFKVGTRDVLYDITTRLVDLIAIVSKAPRNDVGISTIIPCESPNVEDVVALIPAINRQSTTQSQFSDVGGFDIRGFLEHEKEEGGGASQIVSPEMAELITSVLPLSSRFCQWSLAYRPQTHGVSMQTFYRQLADRGPSLLLIRDFNNRVFGGFASESWEPSGKYFGTGESFVFSFDAAGEFNIFPWAARNEFIQFADETMIAMGGGGSAALVVQSDFIRGTSQKCTTFLNPQLSDEEDFVARDLEFWCFDEE
eukprot:GEMP01045429.1.p1 GENE.GEMP01045429.1~~GEMP01045429.1.p1  ORF type:complete len:476 (+),score=55.74 GEMP01045429.1:89-1429(+)